MSIQGATRMTQLTQPRRTGSVRIPWKMVMFGCFACQLWKKEQGLCTKHEFSFHLLASVSAQMTLHFEITFPFITFVSSSPSVNTRILTFQPCKILNEKFSTWLYVPSSLHSGINTCWNSLRACSWVYFLSATHLETSREREKTSQLDDAIWRKDRW